MSKFLTRNLMAALVAMAMVPVAQADLTTNGNFETGDTTGWEDLSGAATFGVTSDSFAGNWAGEILNNSTTLGAVVKQANLGIGMVNPGDLIRIRFAAKGNFEAGGVAIAEFFSELDGGGVSSSEILGGSPFFTGTSSWQEFEFFTTAGPDVSGGVTLQFVAATGAATGSSSHLFIDNVSVSVIPEPTSLSLFGLAGLAALLRRRRN